MIRQAALCVDAQLCRQPATVVRRAEHPAPPTLLTAERFTLPRQLSSQLSFIKYENEWNEKQANEQGPEKDSLDG
jgi:hypothetical protein